MNVVDILIIILVLSYMARGFKNGAIKELALFIGGLLVIVIAYFLKNPVSVLLYKYLPFISFAGPLSGISVINIVFYEIVAFLLVAGILLFIYKSIVFVSSIFEGILKATIILEIPSKIIGIIIGFLEGICVAFILLFITFQFSFPKPYIDSSKSGTYILTKTPLLSNATEPIYKSIEKIHEIGDKYKQSEDKNEANLEALDILLKYKVLDTTNAETLVYSGKLKIENAESIINKYKN